MLWHHADGKAPDWEIPVVAEYGLEGWTPYVKRRWKIRTHNQDMAENSVDQAHFRYVHGTLTVPQSEATTEGPCLHVLSQMKMGTPGRRSRRQHRIEVLGLRLRPGRASAASSRRRWSRR